MTDESFKTTPPLVAGVTGGCEARGHCGERAGCDGGCGGGSKEAEPRPVDAQQVQVDVERAAKEEAKAPFAAMHKAAADEKAHQVGGAALATPTTAIGAATTPAAAPRAPAVAGRAPPRW